MVLDPPTESPKQALTLYPATSADAAALTQLYRRAWNDPNETEAVTRGWLETGGVLTFRGGAAFVCALRWREQPYGWEVGRLATLPEYRGQGLGRWLMTRLEASAIQHNVPELRLTLPEAQAELLPYYARMGYRARDPQGPLTLHKRVGGVWQRQGQ